MIQATKVGMRCDETSGQVAWVVHALSRGELQLDDEQGHRDREDPVGQCLEAVLRESGVFLGRGRRVAHAGHSPTPPAPVRDSGDAADRFVPTSRPGPSGT